MTQMTRREILGWLAAVPAASGLLWQRALADTTASRPNRRANRYDGRVVVVIRMLGGNDGLNAVIPIRDDRYYAARPTIAIAKQQALSIANGALGLHPALADFDRLMQDGYAGIVQGVGYPDSSRSHQRATEIWESGSLADPAPAVGWLGRYLDAYCASDCTVRDIAGIQFGSSMGRTLASTSGRGRLIGNPELLVRMDTDAMQSVAARGPASIQFTQLAKAQVELIDASRLLRRASKASGLRHAYPDTPFGQSLRWTANMIETDCPTHVFYLSIGSFENGAASFDTHIDQLPKHQQLYSELGAGLLAFTRQLRAAGELDRVLALTFSDFGRQLPENKTKGTEHGDASVLFYTGGAVRAGVHGDAPDLSLIRNGGLQATIDFRRIYADVLSNWLSVPVTPILGAGLEPFNIVRPS